MLQNINSYKNNNELLFLKQKILKKNILIIIGRYCYNCVTNSVRVNYL